MVEPLTYAVVLALAPLRVGERVDRAGWPLHVTLVSNFTSPAGSDLLVGVLREAARVLPPLSGVVGDEAWFGPDRDVLVDLVDSADLARAHGRLLDALERHAAAAPIVPAYHRGGYQAHVTVTGSARPARGARLRFGTLALVEVGERFATPIALFDLGSTSAVPPIVDLACALELYGALLSEGAGAAVVGGWGVDALLGELSREHHDLDVLVEEMDLPALWRALDRLGMRVRYVWSENRWIGDLGSPSAFVADGPLGELDVHVVRTEPTGPVHLSESRIAFRAGGLDARGMIGGTAVRCATAETQLLMHTGYQLPPHQREDLERLRALL